MGEINLELRGVKGWLLFLCISMTILDPLSILFNLIFVTNLTKPHFDKQPELLKIIFINGSCSIGLAVFSIYAGLSLWKMVPGAPATAKKYLTAVASYSVISLFIPALAGLSKESHINIFGGNIANIILTVSYATAWYFYLIKSRRVRATYEAKEKDPGTL